MLNKEQKLNSQMFDEGVEKIPIRQGYGEGLLIAGREDERVVALCADLTESTKTHLFANEFPKRFVELGVAEQSLASVASGMAAMGKIPFASSYATFSPGRNWEQIRTTICYNNTNVKIAGAHAGVSVGPDGGTHQAIEDIAITRVIPRMTVISPCDSIEAKKATIASAKMEGPVYIRLAREKTPVITTEDTPFKIGKAAVFFESKGKKNVGIVATGALLHKALTVANEMSSDDLGFTVLNMATIKPLDDKALINLAKNSDFLVTVEEHQVAGGLGSAVSEFLSENHPIRIGFIGVRDKFGQSGEPDELIEYYGMGVEAIKKMVAKLSGE
jgi:transketolase